MAESKVTVAPGSSKGPVTETGVHMLMINPRRETLIRKVRSLQKEIKGEEETLLLEIKETDRLQGEVALQIALHHKESREDDHLLERKMYLLVHSG